MRLLIATLLMTGCIGAPKAQQSWIDSVNQNIQGEANVEFKTVIMGRNRGNAPDNNDEHASSSALVIDYTSPKYGGVSFTGQYLTSWVNYEGGSRDTGISPAESLNLSSFNLLNEAYLHYQIDEKSHMRAGRQVLSLNFARSYNIRHKPQAFEALTYHTSNIEDWEITLGHISKFSSWSSRDFYTNGSQNRFVDVAKVEGVNYSTDGFDFVEASYSGLGNLAVSFYDYYGHDLYNSFGVHLDYQLHYGNWQQLLRLKYLTQQDVGRFTTEVESQIYQLGVQFKKQALSFEVGLVSVPGSDPKNDVRTPFQPNLIVEEPMFEVDLGFTADSLSFYSESSFSWSSHSVYLLLLHTDARQSKVTNTEADLIYSYDISELLNFKFKYAFSRQDDFNQSTDSPWVSDYRFFITYRL